MSNIFSSPNIALCRARTLRPTSVFARDFLGRSIPILPHARRGTKKCRLSLVNQNARTCSSPPATIATKPLHVPSPSVEPPLPRLLQLLPDFPAPRRARRHLARRRAPAPASVRRGCRRMRRLLRGTSKSDRKKFESSRSSPCQSLPQKQWESFLSSGVGGSGGRQRGGQHAA